MAAGMSCKHNKQCSCFVVIFFADIHIVINVACFEYTFTNIDKAASNADFPKSEMLFFPPNIGLSFHFPTLERLLPTLDYYFIYHPWKYWF